MEPATTPHRVTSYGRGRGQPGGFILESIEHRTMRLENTVPPVATTARTSLGPGRDHLRVFDSGFEV